MKYNHQEYINKNKRVSVPDLKVGDWVRLKNGTNYIGQIEKPPTLCNFPNYKDVLRITVRGCAYDAKDFQLWTPKGGDVVVCWAYASAGNMYPVQYITNCLLVDDQVVISFGGVHIPISSCHNVIPYIGQAFEDMR